MKKYCNISKRYCNITKDRIPVYDTESGTRYINGRTDCNYGLCEYRESNNCLLKKTL